MKYRIVSIAGKICIVLEMPDGASMSFMADESNPEYAKWLQEKDRWPLIGTTIVEPEEPKPTTDEVIADLVALLIDQGVITNV